jgi:hypothetical protein
MQVLMHARLPVATVRHVIHIALISDVDRPTVTAIVLLQLGFGKFFHQCARLYPKSAPAENKKGQEAYPLSLSGIETLRRNGPTLER